MSGILDKIQQNYLITIRSETTVHEDSYEEGEGDWVNSWMDQTRNFKTEDLKDIRKFLTEYFEKEHYTELTSEHIDDLLCDLQYSILIDAENCKASRSEIEQWKLGKKKLYSGLLMVEIEVNGVLLDGENLLELLK